MASLQARLGNRELENYAARASSLWCEYGIFSCVFGFSDLSFVLSFFRSLYLPLFSVVLHVDGDVPHSTYATHGRVKISTREGAKRCLFWSGPFLPATIALCMPWIRFIERAASGAETLYCKLLFKCRFISFSHAPPSPRSSLAVLCVFLGQLIEPSLISTFP